MSNVRITYALTGLPAGAETTDGSNIAGCLPELEAKYHVPGSTWTQIDRTLATPLISEYPK